MGTPFIGEVKLAGFNFAPIGWAMCDGSLISIAQNPTFFDVIGTTYGGDGVSSYALPNLLGRVPVHQGFSSIIGATGGNETVTLIGNQMPPHTHSVSATSDLAITRDPTNAVLAMPQRNIYSDSQNTAMSSAAVVPVGGNQPHNNMQPSVAITFIIALFGVFPTID